MVGVAGLLQEDRMTEGCRPLAANCFDAGGAEALILRRLETGLSTVVNDFILDVCRQSVAGFGGTVGRGVPGE